MTSKKLLMLFSLFAFTPFVFANMTSDSLENERRLVNVAERVIMIELVRALSPSTRGSGGDIELAIGLIGVAQSDVSSKALINLLGLRLDGAGAEERTCQILARGESLLAHLKRTKPEYVVNHCQNSFMDAHKRELSKVSDVEINEVCLTASEVRAARDKFVHAIKSKTPCNE